LAEPFLQDADDQLGNRRATASGPDGATRIKQLLNAAKAASDNPNASVLQSLLGDSDPAVRWWAAMGFGNVEAKTVTPGMMEDLMARFHDKSGAVRVAAAWSLNRLDTTEGLRPVLIEGLQGDNIWTRLWAIQTLDEMGEAAKPALPQIREARKNQSNGYVTRIAEQVLAKFGQDH
jgi:HEAT repeat protein